MLRSLLLVAIALFAIAGCGDSALSRGIVITGDGKVGANNARNQRENAQDVLRTAIEDDLGNGWKASVAITELPEWIEDRRGEDGSWRWQKITAVAEITPPAGQTLSEAKQADLDAGSRKFLRQKLALVKSDPSLVAFSIKLGTAAAPPAPPVAQAVQGQRTYVVQPGDTLADISTAFYGSPQHWRLIAQANPAGTQAGQSIVIPAQPAAPAPAP